MIIESTAQTVCRPGVRPCPATSDLPKQLPLSTKLVMFALKVNVHPVRVELAAGPVLMMLAVPAPMYPAGCGKTYQNR
jgi:hypothetical protein